MKPNQTKSAGLAADLDAPTNSGASYSGCNDLESIFGTVPESIVLSEEQMTCFLEQIQEEPQHRSALRALFDRKSVFE